MKTRTGAMIPSNNPPGNQIPAAVRIPAWEQIPLEKRQELAQVLGEMLLKLLQAEVVKHEQPS